MVCGRRDIDVDYLRENTRYSRDISPRDKHVVWFWEILREFSRAEKQAFLRFAWGQSRLPYAAADFTQKFQVRQCSDQATRARKMPSMFLTINFTKNKSKFSGRV